MEPDVSPAAERLRSCGRVIGTVRRWVPALASAGLILICLLAKLVFWFLWPFGDSDLDGQPIKTSLLTLAAWLAISLLIASPSCDDCTSVAKKGLSVSGVLLGFFVTKIRSTADLAVFIEATFRVNLPVTLRRARNPSELGDLAADRTILPLAYDSVAGTRSNMDLFVETDSRDEVAVPEPPVPGIRSPAQPYALTPRGPPPLHDHPGLISYPPPAHVYTGRNFDAVADMVDNDDGPCIHPHALATQSQEFDFASDSSVYGTSCHSLSAISHVVDDMDGVEADQVA